MINLLIQVLTLFSGLVVNFVIPGLYGLEAYGTFIKANVLVFLFQKLLDIVNEQLIASVEAEYTLVTSLFMATLIFLLFNAVNLIDYIGNPLLLGVMLLSSACLLSMFSLRLQRWIVGYLIIFLCVFFTALLLSYLSVWPLSIVDILILTNLIPCLYAVVVLFFNGAKLPMGKQLLLTCHRVLLLLPRMVSITLVFNLFTNILPFILSKSLPVRDLGLFRVIVSIIQSATSLFPVNVRAVFVSFVSGGQRQEQYRIITSIAIFYFALVGLSAYVAVWLFPQYSAYLVMLPCLPVLYWAVVTERYLVACGLHRKVIVTNLVIAPLSIAGMLLFVQDLKQAQLFYAIGFSAYLLFLHVACRPGIKLPVVFWVALLSPLAIFLTDISLIWAVLYMCSLMIIAVGALQLRPADLRTLRF
ncbi:hypothetical protein HX787_20075 [Pseudomonas tolaasii]|uniref:Oligosaccharide flippase family protein n=2 Tax=Pseudomonas tolaasii TaxID=29442 RepID=A0A7Y8DTF5_PSETO|nr:hypothetical protein [Pseudomonas tolaasii]ARB27017.1 hypothetical protein B5P22_06945 [Pseudomonas tolaasii]KAB0466282.1 hypothetical protein F7R12_28855 [Pseudomonas tolaasii]MBW4796400.1 hypothetical protein [Pseudomonas tolaasii]MBY8941455.1 hypothetical protein [Pseudomonas tolaasii]NVZ48509.1 hypothetical protein [Pseudomonas tolaasii]